MTYPVANTHWLEKHPTSISARYADAVVGGGNLANVQETVTKASTLWRTW